MYILLKPFYFWDSGLLQIADFVLIFLILISMIKIIISKKITIPYPSFTVLSLLFLFYVVLVNSIWYIILGNENMFLTNNLFYIYNTLVMLVILFLYYKNVEKFLKTFYCGIVTSIFVQSILFFFVSGDETRTTLFFNNPNQLGYYSLLCLAFLMIIERKINVKTSIFILSVICSFFLIFVSASLGAITGALFIYISYILIAKKKGWIKYFSWLTVLFSILFVYLLITNNPIVYNRFEILNKIIWRFQNSNVYGEGFITERAYDRIINHPEYWLFGAGEGLYTRFNSLADHEIHSTLANIFFSYGLIGFILFLTMLVYIIKKNKWIYAYPVFAILIYGLTHNGIRQSMMWIMFSMLIIITGKIESHKVNGNKNGYKNNLITV